MGLLSDITDFIGEARAIGDEVRGTVRDTAETFVQGKQEVVQTVTDAKTELSGTISEIKETAQKSTDIKPDGLDDTSTDGL